MILRFLVLLFDLPAIGFAFRRGGRVFRTFNNLSSVVCPLSSNPRVALSPRHRVYYASGLTLVQGTKDLFCFRVRQ
jgi:hypothetical protein